MSARSGVRIIGTTGLPRGFDGVYTGAKANMQSLVDWGIENAPARAALTNFLERSKTTLIWRLLCNPDDPHLHADCVLGVMPLIREHTGSDGRTHQCVVTFDRGEPLGDLPPPPPLSLAISRLRQEPWGGLQAAKGFSPTCPGRPEGLRRLKPG